MADSVWATRIAIERARRLELPTQTAEHAKVLADWIPLAEAALAADSTTNPACQPATSHFPAFPLTGPDLRAFQAAIAAAESAQHAQHAPAVAQRIEAIYECGIASPAATPGAQLAGTLARAERTSYWLVAALALLVAGDLAALALSVAQPGLLPHAAVLALNVLTAVAAVVLWLPLHASLHRSRALQEQRVGQAVAPHAGRTERRS